MYNENQTASQIADRQIKKQMLFKAMARGRVVSFLDSREFDLSEFHTTIVFIRQDIEKKNLPWVMKNRWIKFADGKRCKEYWLERREEA